jgi:hypothetical protein
MQRIRFLFLIIVILSTELNGQSAKPSDLVNKIIISIQTENFDSFRKLLLDSTDLNEIYKRYDIKIKAPHSKGFLETEKQFYDSSSGSYKELFEKLLAEGKNFEIDWGQIKNTKLIALDSNGFANRNLKSYIANLYFVYKDTSYYIFYIMLFHLSLGYKIGTIGYIDKLGIFPESKMKQLDSLKLN